MKRRKASDPRAMTTKNAALLLTKLLGRRVPESEVQADLDRGAPTNRDGSIDLVHYAAWLAKRISGSGLATK